MDQYHISFAGAGKVGSALCKEFFRIGFRIDQIVTENENTGRLLADTCEASWSSGLIFPASTQIIIVAVPDHRLEDVLVNIECRPDTLIAHTAGSFGLDVFPDRITRKGIFYPLQTFSKGRDIRFKDLSFLLESSDRQSSLVLQTIAEAIGGKFYYVDTEHRRMLHLAAVFVSNFANHMFTEGKEVARKAGFPFEILRPLIEETVSKALTLGPENSQTGPAIRNDTNTIEKHLDLLSFSPELQKIYNEITASIINHYK